MVLINKTNFDYHLSLGSDMPTFSLPATDGKTYANTDFTKSAQVIAFWCNHCPFVVAAEEQFEALVGEFGDVDFVCINSNESTNYPEDSFAKMQEKDVPYVYLRDKSQEVAKAFGAECTPHVFVFNDGKLVYQGRVDDAGQGSASTHELKDALANIVAGEAVAVPETAAMGCSIKWEM